MRDVNFYKEGKEWLCRDFGDDPLGHIFLYDGKWYFRPAYNPGFGVVDLSTDQIKEIAAVMDVLTLGVGVESGAL